MKNENKNYRFLNAEKISGIVVIFLTLAIGLTQIFKTEIRDTMYTMADNLEKIGTEITDRFNEAGMQLAAVAINHNFRSLVQIQSNYRDLNKKVRILIVPGHEPNYGGAEYGNLKERDMTLELGLNLQMILQKDPHYQVFITRDASGWTPTFQNYFAENDANIREWVTGSKADFSKLLSLKSSESSESATANYNPVGHNKVNQNVATRLYGITKWSNENNIDIVIHIHFNDNPRKNISGPGNYSGFAIYVPTTQYGNSTSAKAIAKGLFKNLSRYSHVSSLPGESVGIVDESELIAIGSNNTSDAASVLIEYAYIYEPQFVDSQSYHAVLGSLAYQTYLGLQDFFGISIANNAFF